MSPIKPKNLVVVSLWAEDVPVAVHFYRDIVGLRLLMHHGPQPALDLGHGAHLVILKGKPQLPLDADPQNFPQIALAVDDLDEAVRHLAAHGVELPWGLESSVGTRWVKFYDPAGNLIELVQFTESTHI